MCVCVYASAVSRRLRVNPRNMSRNRDRISNHMGVGFLYVDRTFTGGGGKSKGTIFSGPVFSPKHV